MIDLTKLIDQPLHDLRQPVPRAALAIGAWLYANAYTQSAKRAADMPGWLHGYNHHRTHSALKALPPASRLNNVLGNDS